MALSEAETGSEMSEYMEQVLHASGSATTLIQHMLAFSRKQVFELETLDLSAVVRDLGKMVQPVIGEYCSGWIKRGPTGVIGTNKPDSIETANCMLEDAASGSILQPSNPGASDIEALVRKRRPNYFSFDDWLRLDTMEVERGQAQGRPRDKFTRVEDMLSALGR